MLASLVLKEAGLSLGADRMEGAGLPLAALTPHNGVVLFISGGGRVPASPSIPSELALRGDCY